MKPKHLGRHGAASAPVCNGGTVYMRRAGLAPADFKATPAAERCKRCAERFKKQEAERLALVRARRQGAAC